MLYRLSVTHPLENHDQASGLLEKDHITVSGKLRTFENTSFVKYWNWWDTENLAMGHQVIMNLNHHDLGFVQTEY